MSEKIPRDLCRLCLTSGTESIEIFSSSSTDFLPPLDERINLCLPVKVSRDDVLPTKLCLLCLENVSNFYEFWVQTESSQERLREIFATTLRENSAEDRPPDGKIAVQVLGTDPVVDTTEDLVENTPLGFREGDKTAVTPTLTLSKNTEPLKNVCRPPNKSPKKTPKADAVAVCTYCSVHQNVSNHPLISTVQPLCGICNQEENRAESRDSRRYACSVCDYSNTSLSNFKIHMMKHNGEHIAKCQYCSKGFYSRTACREHEWMKHEDKSPVTCKECNKSYHSKAYLRLHMKTHSSDFNCDGFQCDACGKTFKSSKGVRRHKMADHAGRLYCCDVCDKQMKSLDSLKNHLKIHSGEKSLVCPSCGKAFRTKNGLSVHERIHTGAKPFKCDICDRSFTQSSTLKIHVRYHRGDRPFQCSDCSKKFVTLTFLNTHRTKHHVPPLV